MTPTECSFQCLNLNYLSLVNGKEMIIKNTTKKASIITFQQLSSQPNLKLFLRTHASNSLHSEDDFKFQAQ